MRSLSGVLVGLFIAAAFGAVLDAVHARDFSSFNDDIAWVTWQDFQAKDLTSNAKPICFVITQPWCGACKKLKSNFVENGAALVEASKHYLMVSIDGEENKGLDTRFQPDGTYVPRTLLANPLGELKPDLVAPGGNPKYKYFYTSAAMVAKSLKMNYEVLTGKNSQEEIKTEL